MISPSQIRAARAMLGLTQADLAAKARISKTALIAIENATSDPKVSTLSAIQHALEAAGVEFTNGEQPGVRMRSYKLKDGGQGAYTIDPVGKWAGFGAVDAGRVIRVQVEDIALERLGSRISGGGDLVPAIDAHRSKIFKIAAEKYEDGLIEAGDVISVTDADVAQRLG